MAPPVPVAFKARLFVNTTVEAVRVLAAYMAPPPEAPLAVLPENWLFVTTNAEELRIAPPVFAAVLPVKIALSIVEFRAP